MPRLITTFTKNTLKVFANVFSSVTRLFSSAEDILFILLIFWQSIIWQFFWNFLLAAQLFNRWLKNKKGAGRWRGQPVLHHFYEFYFFSCFIYLFACFFYGMLAAFTSSKLCPQNICVNLIFWCYYVIYEIAGLFQKFDFLVHKNIEDVSVKLCSENVYM